MANIQVRKLVCESLNFEHVLDGRQSLDKHEIKLRIKGKTRGRLQNRCQICFSSKQTQWNPIKTCNKCGIKFHVCCFKSTSHKSLCQDCEQHHMSAGPCCYCKSASMPLKTIEQEGTLVSYHVFCLMLSGQAVARGAELLPSTAVTHSPQMESFGACFKCGKSGHLATCTGCGQRWHPLCAYLDGARFRAQPERDLQVDLELTCCDPGWNNELQGLTRRSLINYRPK
jgi:hypothetical protein